MPYPALVLKNHLSTAELKKHYLSAKKGIERTRWHLLWLMSKKEENLTAEQAAKLLGRTADWARKTIRRYNRGGPQGITDKRSGNGNQKMLNKRQQRSLKQTLSKRPQDGGLWTGPKVACFISALLKVKVSSVTGWKYLRYLGFGLQTPRPSHTKAASPEEQAAFKKTSKQSKRA